MSNEQIFADYIKEMVEQQGTCALNSDWVLWMLKTIETSGSFILNPKWIRASHGSPDDPEPVMFCELTITENGRPPPNAENDSG